MGQLERFWGHFCDFKFFFHEVNVQNGDIYLGSLKLHNFIWGGGGGMPDILDILFSVNSKCRVHAYV